MLSVDVQGIDAPDHIQWNTHTYGRTPLDEGSARRRNLYLTTHKRQTHPCPPPGGIRTRNPSTRAAAGIGEYLVTRDYMGDHITKNEMDGECGTYRGEEMWIQCFGGETWAKRFARPSRRGEDNIKRDLKGIRCEDVDWIDLAQDTNSLLALVNAMMNLRVQ